MSKSNRVTITILCDDVIETHAYRPHSEFSTVCGLDANDDSLFHIIELSNKKIDCESCKELFKSINRYTKRDFT